MRIRHPRGELHYLLTTVVPRGTSVSLGAILSFKIDLPFRRKVKLKRQVAFPESTVLQMRRGKRDNLGIIFHITPLKHMF